MPDRKFHLALSQKIVNDHQALLPYKYRTMRIPQIERLVLPKRYPTPEAMKSSGHNEHFYHPDMWEHEYLSYRRMKRMTDCDLRRRYVALVRNMRSYTEPEREIIPLNSYQSSWYWFRKEYQTRLEFALRGIEPPKFNYEPQRLNESGPAHPKVPNGTEIIFRYGKREYMRRMVEQGTIRVSPAESYKCEENNAARQDDELQKHSYMPGQNTTITRASGQRLKVIGDIRRTISGPQYHLVCFSCVWYIELFADFHADTCVVVTDPAKFERRLETAGRTAFPGWYFHSCPVQYFDPYERTENEFFNAAMSKDFRFAYQNEYRILWSQMTAAPVVGFQSVEIGPAHDLMTMYNKRGEEIRL